MKSRLVSVFGAQLALGLGVLVAGSACSVKNDALGTGNSGFDSGAIDGRADGRADGGKGGTIGTGGITATGGTRDAGLDTNLGTGGVVGTGGTTVIVGTGGTTLPVGTGGTTNPGGKGGTTIPVGTGGIVGSGGVAGGTGSGGTTGVCTVGQKRCSGNLLETCLSSLQWDAGVACAWPTPVCSGTACASSTLTVTKNGSGLGTVTSPGTGGISCGTTCSAAFSQSPVVLTATPSAGSTFEGWSGGGCSGTGTCSVALTSGDVAVIATFSLQDNALAVNKTGAGTGTVTSSSGGINCGTACSATYDYGTSVTLTATAASGSLFTGWSGACSGTTATCTVSITAATTVTANFVLSQNTLTISRAGTGSGTVSSSTGGINCGATCSASYAYGASVVLTASAAAGSTFTGWSGGGCTGTSTCTVSVNAPTVVTANFTLGQYVLTVTKGGNAASSGTVKSNAGGIDCGSSCSASYSYGSSVTLTATAGTGSDFTGWSGACTNASGTCTVTMNAATSVTANFTLKKFELSVEKDGTGTGTVRSSETSSPVIDCGSACLASLDYNTSVTLTADPDDSSTFTRWTGGGCATVTGPCTVSMTVARTIKATFTRRTVTLEVNKTGTGLVKSSETPTPSINCGPAAGCSADYSYGTDVTLVATPPEGASVTWSENCVAEAATPNTCTVKMNGNQTVIVTFTSTPQFTLRVTKGGNASGTVTSAPSGIECGTACSATFPAGAVTLTATAPDFVGWTVEGMPGACTGTDACTVTMSADTNVKATFAVALRCEASTQQVSIDACPSSAGGNIDPVIPTGSNCETECGKGMANAGWNTGCWIVDGESACHCRNSAFDAAQTGTLSGGGCTMPPVPALPAP